MNSVSARSSCDDSSARWPSIECIRGRTTPPSTMSSIPSRSSRTLATSSALVITVTRRPAISRAKASAVVPLPIAIVVSSATRAAAARAMARFASMSRVAPRRRGEALRQRRAAIGADEPSLAGEALEVPPDRGRRDAEVVGELGDAARRPSARRCSTRRARRSVSRMRGSCATGARIVNVGACCAQAKCHRMRGSCARTFGRIRSGHGLPAGRPPRPGRVQLAARHLHGAGARPPPEPAQGAAARRPRRGHASRDGRVQARGRARAGHDRDRHPARPGDRRGHRRSRTGRCPAGPA